MCSDMCSNPGFEDETYARALECEREQLENRSVIAKFPTKLSH